MEITILSFFLFPETNLNIKVVKLFTELASNLYKPIQSQHHICKCTDGSAF